MESLMSVSILVCGCGLKVRAAGATPGRVGRCPRCGGELRVPEFLPPVEPVEATTADPNGPEAGYGLKPAKNHSVRKKKGRAQPSDITPSRSGFVERKSALSMAGGILPPLVKTETSWFASILYPLRSADSLAVIAALTAILWLFTILVPEYCLGLMGDADGMGVPTVGKLIALISILPVAFLLPFAVFYWVQYLGRVLVASGMGETIPPRTPDRNFDGFLSGLSPWFTWLFLGLGVGLLPAALCRLSFSSETPGALLLPLGLAGLGLPYILTALLMTFLHDDALAAKPLAVLTALFQLGGSFLFLCVFVTILTAAAGGIFALTSLLRNGFFKTYILACVPCWALFVWTTIVLMRLLGNYYHPRRKALGWNQDRPRWGVLWKL
jgi:hypothetical protein